MTPEEQIALKATLWRSNYELKKARLFVDACTCAHPSVKMAATQQITDALTMSVEAVGPETTGYWQEILRLQDQVKAAKEAFSRLDGLLGWRTSDGDADGCHHVNHTAMAEVQKIIRETTKIL